MAQLTVSPFKVNPKERHPTFVALSAGAAAPDARATLTFPTTHADGSTLVANQCFTADARRGSASADRWVLTDPPLGPGLFTELSGPRHANSASPGQGERGSTAGPMRKNERGGRKGEPTPRRGVVMGFGGLPPEKFSICKISTETNPIPNKKEGMGRGRAIHSLWSG